ncbi:MAG: hypothetical protein QXL94_05970, partial [Candidatus Parvarchaeum sp.]
MGKQNLDELVESAKKEKFTNYFDLPDKAELEKDGLKFIDERQYILTTAAYIGFFNPQVQDISENLVNKRDFNYEFDNIDKISKLIPENCVKPVSLVYDDSIAKGYICGYVVDTRGKNQPLKQYLRAIK